MQAVHPEGGPAVVGERIRGGVGHLAEPAHVDRGGARGVARAEVDGDGRRGVGIRPRAGHGVRRRMRCRDGRGRLRRDEHRAVGRGDADAVRAHDLPGRGRHDHRAEAHVRVRAGEVAVVQRGEGHRAVRGDRPLAEPHLDARGAPCSSTPV